MIIDSDQNNTYWAGDSDTGLVTVAPFEIHFYMYLVFAALMAAGFYIGKGYQAPKWLVCLGIFGVVFAAGLMKAMELNPNGVFTLLFPMVGVMAGRFSAARAKRAQ